MKSVQLVRKLRGMSAQELEREAAELRKKVWTQSVQQATGQLQDHHRVRQAKRDLARVLTVKRQMASEKAR
jgi:large subunit ribosomal protein L29